MRGGSFDLALATDGARLCYRQPGGLCALRHSNALYRGFAGRAAVANILYLNPLGCGHTGNIHTGAGNSVPHAATIHAILHGRCVSAADYQRTRISAGGGKARVRLRRRRRTESVDGYGLAVIHQANMVRGVIAGEILRGNPARFRRRSDSNSPRRRTGFRGHADLRTRIHPSIDPDGTAYRQADIVCAITSLVILNNSIATDRHCSGWIASIRGRNIHAAAICRSRVIDDLTAVHIKLTARTNEHAAALTSTNMVAADLAAVHIDCNCTSTAAGFTLSDNSSLCIPCDLAAIHVECAAAGLTNLYFDAIERTAIEIELAATRYCYTTIGFTGIRFQFPIHTTVRQLRGAGWVNASNIGKRHGIAVQTDVGVLQSGIFCQGHISGQVVIARSRQFIRLSPRLECHVRMRCMPQIGISPAADAMRMDALLTQHNRIAIVIQIKLKARAIILEAIRYKLPEILPACRIRHGNALAQVLLPFHRNAEFRGRVKRIKVNLLICRQQNVLVIAGNLRLAAERKVAAPNMHAYRIPTDFAALHGECAAIEHNACCAACDLSAAGLAPIHQRQAAAASDLYRRNIAGSCRNCLPVQAKENFFINLPCAVKRNCAANVVVSVLFDFRQCRHLRKLHIAMHMRWIAFFVLVSCTIIAYPIIGLFQAGIPICTAAVYAPRIYFTTLFIAIIIELHRQLTAIRIRLCHTRNTLGAIRVFAI